MRLPIPIYFREDRRKQVFTCRPVFADGPVTQHADVDRALHRLTEDLRRQAVAAAEAGDHDQLLALTGDPEVAEQRVAVAVDLRSRHLAADVLVAVLPVDGGVAVRFLDLPGPWFLVTELKALAEQCSAQLRQRLKRKLDRDEPLPTASDLAAAKRAWIAVVDLWIDLPPPKPAKEVRDPRLAGLEEDEAGDGAVELDRTGLRLDLAPGTGRAHGRDVLVQDLRERLIDDVRRPILVVGPGGAGKSSVIADAVRHQPGQPHRPAWLLAPGRLISGMSVVGQWEARVEAICRHAQAHDQILVVDDLIGLFRAGVSASGNLGIAAVLKSWLADSRIRLVVEATWEVFHAAQELDRGFTDLFQVITVAPLGETAAANALARLAIDLETDAATTLPVQILPDALRQALALARRYHGDRALPGPAADLVRRAATSGGAVSRATVLAQFSAASGIPLHLADAAIALDRAMLAQQLRRHLIGQDAAVDALTDALVLAKAGLNDPARPLGTFLFTGPTGAGKTQAARALARVLFGSDERLLRIDLNEYAGADAVERLAGSLHRPDGVLTSAIRRQPFAVVLLDEIEKADAGVHDLLLQVLGEARLTDALGRTASFANAVLILTSNLGAREAEAASLAFGASAATAADRYRGAIQGFFRPEFVARLDRVVPFTPLTADGLAAVAGLVLGEVAGRSGLLRRRWRLDAPAPVRHWLGRRAAQAGIGGRALRHLVDELVLRPLSAAIAASGSTIPSQVRLAVVDDQVQVTVVPHTPRPALAPALETWTTGDDQRLLDRCDAALAELDRQHAGPVALETADANLAAHFAAKEDLARLRKRIIGRQRRGGATPISLGRRFDRQLLLLAWATGEPWQQTVANDDDLGDSLAMELDLILERLRRGADQVLAVTRFSGTSMTSAQATALFSQMLGVGGLEIVIAALSIDTQINEAMFSSLKIVPLPEEIGQWGYLVSGTGASALLEALAGRHLFRFQGDLHQLDLAIMPWAGTVRQLGATWPTVPDRLVALWDLDHGGRYDFALDRWFPLEADAESQAAWSAMILTGSRP